jgi:hypothetical protein
MGKLLSLDIQLNYYMRKTKKRKYLAEEEAFIRENYPIFGSQYCADYFEGKFTTTSISRFCSRNNIKFIKKGHNFNLDDFVNISKPSVAYFMGLFFGDGFLTKKSSTIMLTVVKEDGYEFLNMLKELGDWNVKEKPSWKGRKPTLKLSINNYDIGKYFKRLGFEEKSLIDPFEILNVIPSELHRYFWLGFLDADGTIMIYKNYRAVSFSGTYDQDWTSLTNFLKNIGINPTIERRIRKSGHKVSRVSFFKSSDIIKFCDYLYQDWEENEIGLKRKRNKFLEIRSACENSKIFQRNNPDIIF